MFCVTGLISLGFDLPLSIIGQSFVNDWAIVIVVSDCLGSRGVCRLSMSDVRELNEEMSSHDFVYTPLK